MHMEPAAQVEGGVPGMGVLIDNRPRCARAGAARKRAAPSPWLSAGGKKETAESEPGRLGISRERTTSAGPPAQEESACDVS